MNSNVHSCVPKEPITSFRNYLHRGRVDIVVNSDDRKALFDGSIPDGFKVVCFLGFFSFKVVGARAVKVKKLCD